MRCADVLQQLRAAGSALLASVLLAGALVACGSVSSGPGGGGASSAAAGGAAGSGGEGAAAGAAAGGAGGSGGGSACTPPDEGCAGSDKCTIVDEALGVPGGLGCAVAGPRGPFEPCDADAVCAAGLWCDYTTAVCKPLCNVGELGCEARDDCVFGRDSAGLPIPGLGVCLAQCNPIAAAVNPCADHPDTTCFYRVDEGAFDCGLSGDKPWPNVCNSHQECAYGLGCLGGTCRDWCPTLGAECMGTKGDGTFYCENFAPCGTCSPSGFTFEDAPLGGCL